MIATLSLGVMRCQNSRSARFSSSKDEHFRSQILDPLLRRLRSGSASGIVVWLITAPSGLSLPRDLATRKGWRVGRLQVGSTLGLDPETLNLAPEGSA